MNPRARLFPMSKLVDEAVEVLKTLPQEQQATVARAILDYGAHHDDDLQLTDEQVIEVERRIASPNRQFVTVDEVRTRLRRFGA